MQVSVPPVWELVLTILATYALTGVIDHDRPLVSVWQLLRSEFTAPRAPRPRTGRCAPTASIGASEGEPCSDILGSRQDPATPADWRCATSRTTCASPSTRRGPGSCCPTQPWAFRSDRQREQLMFGVGDGLAWLAGHRLHLRVTSRPYPTAEWAKRLHELTPNPLRDARRRRRGPSTWSRCRSTCGTRRWPRSRSSSAYGWRTAPPSPPAHRGGLATPGQHRARPPAVARSSRSPRRVALPGLEGRPATAREMEWLLRRSMGIGLPAPATLSSSRAGRVGGRGPAQLRRPGRLRRARRWAAPCS